MRSHFSKSGCLTSSNSPDLALLDHDLLAQALVPRLLLTIFWITPRYGTKEHSSYSLSCQKPPRSYRNCAMASSIQLSAKGTGFPASRLAHHGLHLLARELPVHLGHGLVVLGLLADVPDHELQPAVGNEAQAIAEHVGRRQLPIGLALHHLDDHLAVLGGHVLLAKHVTGHRPPSPRPGHGVLTGLLQHFAGDDQLLDLAGALVDAQGPDLAVQALHRAPRITPWPAVELHRAVHHALRRLGGEELRRGPLRRDRSCSLVASPRGEPVTRSRAASSSTSHLRQGHPGGLELGEGASRTAGGPGRARGLVESAGHEAAGGGADAGAERVQGGRAPGCRPLPSWPRITAGTPSKRTSPRGWGAIGSKAFTARPGASPSTRNMDSPSGRALELRASTV